VQLEELGQLKNPMTSSGIEPTTFRLVAQCHNRVTGHAIAQAVSRWLPKAAARVRSCGICGGQSGNGAGFLRVLRFPLPVLIPPIAP
jgi:hypothetical protein